MIFRQRWHSPMGEVLLQATPHALTGVWFFDQKYAPDGFETPTPAQHYDDGSRVIEATVTWLEHYFSATGGELTRPPLAPSGTEFQQSVWDALLGIPCGQTTTYGALAQQIKKPRAVRAVAAAVGRNPVSLIIPCHRVIGANGSLTGYAGGLNRKEGLLALEHSGAVQVAFS